MNGDPANLFALKKMWAQYKSISKIFLLLGHGLSTQPSKKVPSWAILEAIELNKGSGKPWSQEPINTELFKNQPVVFGNPPHLPMTKKSQLSEDIHFAKYT